MSDPGHQKGNVSPARRVISAFGYKRTAQIADLTDNAIRKWEQRGGLVPAQYQQRFLDVARAENLPLTAEDLIAAPASAEAG
jgi:hypothetical protein